MKDFVWACGQKWSQDCELLYFVLVFTEPYLMTFGSIALLTWHQARNCQWPVELVNEADILHCLTSSTGSVSRSKFLMQLHNLASDIWLSLFLSYVLNTFPCLEVFFGSAHLIGWLLDESIIWPAQQNQQKKNVSTDIKPSTKMLGTSFAPLNWEQHVREKNGRSAIDLWWWRDSLHP
jgi:hypothetical protein